MHMHNIGLVGMGYWGPNIAKSFLSTNRAVLRWLCDSNQAHLETIASRYPTARLTNHLEEMLADPDLDAVVVATPTATHYSIAQQVLVAKKHLLVEKPLTTSTQEIRHLIQLSRQVGKCLMVGHIFSYNAGICALKEIIQRGELGQIYYLSMERTNLGPVRTDVNALWDLATHDISIMVELLNDLPMEVTALGMSYLNPSIEDVVFATFAFKNKMIVNIHASWLEPKKVRKMVVVGDQKMAVWDDLDLTNPIRIFNKSVQYLAPDKITGSFLEYKTMVVDGGQSSPNVTLNQPLQAECEHFLDCIESGRLPLTDGINAMKVVQSLEAATLSMQQRGAPVTILPLEIF
ncbi:MAG: Gfo/Idh/MocA family oxidoreductase [Magnetococcus sp. DMHC-6]